MSGVLPDRERRHLLQFYLMPQLGYGPRVMWAGGVIVAALAIQILWPSSPVAASLVVSLPMLLAGNLLLLVQGYNLQPAYSVRRGDWEKTTREKFRDASRLQDKVASWDQAFADVTCPLGLVGLLMVGGMVAVMTMALASNSGTVAWAPVFAVDAAVLLLPHWISGTRRGWRPVALRQQIDSLQTALRTLDSFEDPPCQIQPMFEVAGKGDKRTPIAARVFVRFPDGPEDLLGLQYQVSINDVQGTKYPYLYAVIVARKSFGLLGEPLLECRRRLVPRGETGGVLAWLGVTQPKDKLTVESSSEDDVDVIIIRQHTTKKSGYHTGGQAISNIARAAWQVASDLAAPPVAAR